MGDSITDRFVLDVGERIEYGRGATTPRPGDVSSAGTPGGVGVLRDTPTLLEPGDVGDVEIEASGARSNPVGPERRVPGPSTRSGGVHEQLLLALM